MEHLESFFFLFNLGVFKYKDSYLVFMTLLNPGHKINPENSRESLKSRGKNMKTKAQRVRECP